MYSKIIAQYQEEYFMSLIRLTTITTYITFLRYIYTREVLYGALGACYLLHLIQNP